MSEVKHTQGPWEYDWGQKRDGVVENWIVGQVDGDEFSNVIVSIANDYDDAENTARLIAAAPDMKSLAEKAVNAASFYSVEPSDDERSQWLETTEEYVASLEMALDELEYDAKKAIAKVEGKTDA
ncbi:hypothetical protein [Kiloniella litopenaei]|uniref:hypothetical protein n=1 Tax=Kiloniella litopenaei TaxID=1549748 RepID=UPI003BABD0CE